MNFAEATLPKDNTADSDKCAYSERFQPERTMDQNPDQVSALQAQLNEMQVVMRQQAEIILGHTAAKRNRHASQHQGPNTMSSKVLKQFIKSPSKFYIEVNPQKPRLLFDRSNYTKWETAIDRALQHAFVQDQSFLNNKQDNF
jgi:hypothetical protein